MRWSLSASVPTRSSGSEPWTASPLPLSGRGHPSVKCSIVWSWLRRSVAAENPRRLHLDITAVGPPVYHPRSMHAGQLHAVPPERTRSPALLRCHLRSPLSVYRPTGGQAHSPRVPDGSCLPLLPPERRDRLLQGQSTRDTGGFRQQDSVHELRVRPVQPRVRHDHRERPRCLHEAGPRLRSHPGQGRRALPQAAWVRRAPLAGRCRERRLPFHRVRGRPAGQDRA